MNEVIVVGAGPAGSATAIHLVQRGHDVLLLDAARFPRRKACAEYLSPGGAAILERLGALDVLGSNAGRWLEGMTIRTPAGTSHLVDYRGPDGRPRHGLAIARTCLDATLVQLARRAGATVREGCRVRSVTLSDERVSGVELASGETLRARLIVGADGLHSVVARAAGPPLPVRWPRRLGLVAHLQGVPWPEPAGEMRVGKRGYVGVAPLDGQGLLTVGLVRRLPARGQPAVLFDDGLAEHPQLAARLRSARRVEPVIGIGPMARRVRASAGHGYVLVGDAAGFFDPFTGEGIFRALRGAEIAATYAHQVLSSDAEDLHSYGRARHRAFAAKEQLTAIIQAFVQTPTLLELAVRRLQERPRVARELGNMLGDLTPARLRVVARLLAP
jgi:geranylgeranyl reductase family protein